MRIALLSNVTVDFVAATVGKAHEVYVPAGFDTWQQEALLENSGLRRFSPEAVIVLLHADSLSEAWGAYESGYAIVSEWLSSIRATCEAFPGVPVFASSLDVDDSACRFGAEVRPCLALERDFDEGVQRLHDEGMPAYLLPVRDEVSRLGREAFYSKKMWYVGSMPYSPKGLRAISDLIIRRLRAVSVAPLKCLAVDLDNTLWGGVVGEDGVEGIVLSGSKEGARYQDAQRLLKRMRDRGVMLAVLSKNNTEDVNAAFAHPSMVLGRDDFVAEAINWDPKPQNIRHLAEDLNIGLDSFAFLDDNPAERELMRQECPEVTVIDFPQDTSLLPQAISEAYERHFLSMEVTGEDARKTEMYRSDAGRRSEKRSSASIGVYLRRLEMSMDMHLLRNDEVTRAVQLAGKTNQFNLTTIRYTREEIERLSSDDESNVIAVCMSDKYGDQGLVALVVLRYKGDIAHVESFLMSCRVMGREAEREIMSTLKERLIRKDVKRLRASYRRTAKNTPVSKLYEGLGFETLSTGSEEAKEYEIEVSELPSTTGYYSRVEEIAL